MAKCILKIFDQVNVKFEGLDPVMRHKLHNAVKFMIPSAHHMPKFKLGRWDGKISFCSVAGATYLNLLDRLLPILEEENIEIEIDDRRLDYDFIFPEVDENILSHKTWPSGHKKAGQPIILEDHQVHIVNSLLNNIQSIFEAGTGAGKTISCALLSSLIEPYGRSIVIVPSKNLVVQTEKDYKNIGLDVGVYYGDRKESNHTHIIATWQSLANVSDFEIFTKNIICVICDECHSVSGKVLRELLIGNFSHIPIRWGLTGTIPKEEHEAICLLAAIGPKIGEIKTAALQEKRFLANCKIDIIQIQDADAGFSDYTSERDFLLKNEFRLNYICDFIKETSTNGNTLVLVEKIDTGKFLQQSIPNSIFIQGKIKIKDREAEYETFKIDDNKITIATYGTMSVGISIDRIFNLILIEPGKSFKRVIQSLGRSFRTAKDKDFVNIYDICSSLKYSKRHLSKRKELYTEAKHPFVLKKVELS